MEVGQVLEVSGSVRGNIPPERPKQVSKNDEIYLDMRVTTGRKSFAHFDFTEGGEAWVGEIGEIVFNKRRVWLASGGVFSRATIVAGNVLAVVGGLGRTLAFVTPHSILGITGTEFLVQVDPYGTLVAVGEGEVIVQAIEPWTEIEEELRPNGIPVTVRAGSYVYVPRGGRPTQPVPTSPEVEVSYDPLLCCDFRIGPPQSQ